MRRDSETFIGEGLEEPLLGDRLPGYNGNRRDDDDNGSVKDNEDRIVLDHLGFGLVISSLMLVSFISSLDTTVATALLATIGNEFDELSLVAWIGISFLVGSTAVNPVAGKLIVILGRRQSLIISTVLLSAGCLGCGMSYSMGVLIAARALQGVGAGALSMVFVTLIVDLVVPEKLAFWQSTMNTAWGLGGAIGGVYGGSIHAYVGWRYAFTLQVPFILLAAVTILIYVPKESHKEGPPIQVDYFGCLTLVVATILLTIAISTGGNQYPWTSPIIIGSLVAALVLFGLFVIIERHVAEPVIPLSMLRLRNVYTVATAQFLGGMSCLVCQFYFPIWLSIVRGYNAQWVGINMIPMSISISVSGLIAGTLMFKFGHYMTIAMIGFAIHVLAAAGLAVGLSQDSPVWHHLVAIGLFGFGECGWNAVTFVVVIQAVEKANVPPVASVFRTARWTGAPIGVAVAAGILANQLAQNLHGRVPPHIIERVTQNADTIAALPAELRNTVLTAYNDALRIVFLFVLATALMAWFCAVFMRIRKNK